MSATIPDHEGHWVWLKVRSNKGFAALFNTQKLIALNSELKAKNPIFASPNFKPFGTISACLKT